MKKVINGKLCNTETAKLIGEYGENQSSSLDWIYERLFRTKSGVYFIAGEGGSRSVYGEQIDCNSWSSGENIHILSEQAAREWAENHLTADEYIAEFELQPEDKTAVTVYLETSVIEELDRIKSETGKSRTVIICEMITNAIRNEKR